MNDKAPDSTEALEIKARHQIARMEHERELALMDASSLAKMPLPLRMIFDDRLRAKVEQAATDMAEAHGFTPKHLMGKLAACKVVIVKSIGWNLDPYAVANATYELPNGRVGFEGVLYRAIAEASGLIVGEFKYDWYGDWDCLPRPSFKMGRSEHGKLVPQPAWEYWGEIERGLGITVSAQIAQTGETKSLNFDLIDAYPRNATTWPTRPKLQIINPATRAFVTLVKPSLLMGVHFRDAPEDAPEMREINPEARAEVRHQPAAPPEWRIVYGIHGDEFTIAPSEVEQWARSQIDGATGDQIDQLLQNNEAWLAEVVAGLTRRAAPPTPRDIPQTAPGRHPAREEPPQDAGYSAAPAEPSRRVRRSYEQIKADLIQDIRNAQSVEEVNAVLASRDYANRSPEMKADIDAEAEAMINALREADLETGEIGPDPDRGNLDDRVSVPGDFDRGEPRHHIVEAKIGDTVDLPPEVRAGDIVSFREPSAAAPTYKLLGLAGTLIEILPAEEWFGELEERIADTSPGQRQQWLMVNRGIMQKILADRPDLAERRQDVVTKANQEGDLT